MSKLLLLLNSPWLVSSSTLYTGSNCSHWTDSLGKFLNLIFFHFSKLAVSNSIASYSKIMFFTIIPVYFNFDIVDTWLIINFFDFLLLLVTTSDISFIVFSIVYYYSIGISYSQFHHGIFKIILDVFWIKSNTFLAYSEIVLTLFV